MRRILGRHKRRPTRVAGPLAQALEPRALFSGTFTWTLNIPADGYSRTVSGPATDGVVQPGSDGNEYVRFQAHDAAADAYFSMELDDWTGTGTYKGVYGDTYDNDVMASDQKTPSFTADFDLDQPGDASTIKVATYQNGAISGTFTETAFDGSTAATITGTFSNVTVTPILPDLISIAAGTLPKTAKAGDVLKPALNVYDGWAPAKGTLTDSFYISKTTTLAGAVGPAVATSVHAIDLKPSATVPTTYADPQTVTVPATLASGTYYLVSVVNSDRNITERDYTNNTAVAGPFTVSGKPQITLKTSSNQTTFHLTADAAGGHMPQLVCDATLTGAKQSLASTVFTWTAQVKLDHATDAHAQHDEDTTFALGKTTGGHLSFASGSWSALRGGALTVTATATVDGQSVTSTPLANLKIVGDNPTVDLVRKALGSDTLRKIAHLESNFAQFTSAGLPLFSKDNKNGAGVMQVTPVKSADDEWNWLTAVKDGIAVYNHALTLTATYVASLRSSTKFAALVTQYNAARAAQHLSKLTVVIPSFTTTQQTNDAIRGYNGWAGTDPVDSTLHLHEYRLKRDSAGHLMLSVSGTVGTAIWEQVPAADRPQASGDPNYVQHVLAETA